ncbi:hypothetical protein RHGRI_006906 [Rhododendron griersonianum]|uniref:Uncharacterized protein n=1 Tax=Rhododendron griersonianum TaxID=479676 RepID=A0AAV6KWG1_9ERIC|nr:hypothetical protein RHGRI_006906 [Rhododendron griersonianum]
MEYSCISYFRTEFSGSGNLRERSERALRERIVWRSERFPVGFSGPPRLHLLDSRSDEVFFNEKEKGDPLINVQAIPYDPNNHEEWLINNAKVETRNRHNDRENSSSADPSQHKLLVHSLSWDTIDDKLRFVFSSYSDIDEAVVYAKRPLTSPRATASSPWPTLTAPSWL